MHVYARMFYADDRYPKTRIEDVLFPYFNIFPPAWQLGTSVGYMPCLQYVVVGCAPISGGPLEIIAGTSLY